MLDQKYLDEIHMQCHAKSKVFAPNFHAMSCQIKSICTKFPCNVMLDQKYLDEIHMQCHAKSKVFAPNSHG
jgi:hypothetical protein